MPTSRRSNRSQYVQSAKSTTTAHPGDNLYACPACFNYDDRPGTKMPLAVARWTRSQWNHAMAYIDRHPTFPEGVYFPPYLLHAAIAIGIRMGIITIINPVAYEQLRVPPQRVGHHDQADGFPVHARSIFDSIGREQTPAPFPQPNIFNGYPQHPHQPNPGNLHHAFSAAQSAAQQHQIIQQHSMSSQGSAFAAQNRPQQPVWAQGPPNMLYPWNGGPHGGLPLWWPQGSAPAPPQTFEEEPQAFPGAGQSTNVPGPLHNEQGKRSRICILSPRTSPQPMDLTPQEAVETNNPQAGRNHPPSPTPARVMHSVQPPASSLTIDDVHFQGDLNRGSGEAFQPQCRAQIGPQCPPAATSNASDFPPLVI